jgi:hypothetical protein
MPCISCQASIVKGSLVSLLLLLTTSEARSERPLFSRIAPRDLLFGGSGRAYVPMQPLQVRVTSLAKLPELLDALTRGGYLAVQARRNVIEIHRTPSSGDAREDLNGTDLSDTALRKNVTPVQ